MFNNSKKVKASWQGSFYNKKGQFDMGIEDLQIQPDCKVTGGGTDSHGQFTIEGSFDPKKNTISFKKSRESGSIVDYNGKYVKDEQILKGTWTIGNHIGQFDLKLLSVKYRGVSFFGNMQKSLDWNISKYKGQSYGFGVDELGAFVLRSVKQSGKTLNLEQSYLGQTHKMSYEGKWSKNAGTKVYAGQWKNLSTGHNGSFNMTADSFTCPKLPQELKRPKVTVTREMVSQQKAAQNQASFARNSNPQQPPQGFQPQQQGFQHPQQQQQPPQNSMINQAGRGGRGAGMPPMVNPALINPHANDNSLGMSSMPGASYMPSQLGAFPPQPTIQRQPQQQQRPPQQYNNQMQSQMPVQSPRGQPAGYQLPGAGGIPQQQQPPQQQQFQQQPPQQQQFQNPQNQPQPYQPPQQQYQLPQQQQQPPKVSNMLQPQQNIPQTNQYGQQNQPPLQSNFNQQSQFQAQQPVQPQTVPQQQPQRNQVQGSYMPGLSNLMNTQQSYMPPNQSNMLPMGQQQQPQVPQQPMMPPQNAQFSMNRQQQPQIVGGNQAPQNGYGQPQQQMRQQPPVQQPQTQQRANNFNQNNNTNQYGQAQENPSLMKQGNAYTLSLNDVHPFNNDGNNNAPPQQQQQPQAQYQPQQPQYSQINQQPAQPPQYSQINQQPVQQPQYSQINQRPVQPPQGNNQNFFQQPNNTNMRPPQVQQQPQPQNNYQAYGNNNVNNVQPQAPQQPQVFESVFVDGNQGQPMGLQAPNQLHQQQKFTNSPASQSNPFGSGFGGPDAGEEDFFSEGPSNGGAGGFRQGNVYTTNF